MEVLHVRLETDAENDDVLALFRDNKNAWKVLLHWKIKGCLPPLRPADDDEEAHADAAIQLLCQCWILGELYDVLPFQDVIMLELLHVLQEHVPSLAALKLVFGKSLPNSKLCELMGEEIAEELKRDRTGLWVAADLEEVAGLKDSMGLVFRAMRTRTAEEMARLGHREIWSTYLVGDGPHWVCGADHNQEMGNGCKRHELNGKRKLGKRKLGRTVAAQD